MCIITNRINLVKNTAIVDHFCSESHKSDHCFNILLVFLFSEISLQQFHMYIYIHFILYTYGF